MSAEPLPARGKDAGEFFEELDWWVFKAAILKAALELEIFTHLAAGHQTIGAVARAANLSERGVKFLLPALVGLNLLAQAGDIFTNAPFAAEFLVRDRPNYIGDDLFEEMAWNERGRLAEAVRTGAPLVRGITDDTQGKFWAGWARFLFAIRDYRAQGAREMWNAVGVNQTNLKGARVLDVACGAAIKSLVLAQADPRVTIVAVDWPEVIAVARRAAEAFGVARQVEFRAGDALAADFGENEFDLALVSFITQFLDPPHIQNLFDKIARALKPGSRFVLNTLLADTEESRVEGMWVLMASARGEVYSLAQYAEMLARAGLRDAQLKGAWYLTARK